ncbi:MAG: DUF1232 domain-containing protein [Archangium sp.]|nr:DUF1232 domain-containing protein [Archangium sp.]
MSIVTVGDLRKVLDERGWSCEALAAQVPISNMTLRRLLTKPDEALVPEKYQQLLNGLLSPPAAPAQLDPVEVVLSGMQQTRAEVLASLEADGRGVRKPELVLRDVGRRFDARDVPRAAMEMLSELRTHFPKVGRAGQALILGGLAYFLNPFDLIADTIVAVGFIDDLGVLALIHARMLAKTAKP